MNNIVTRALSGAVYVGLIVAAIVLLAGGRAELFLALFALFTIVGIAEAERLLLSNGGQPWGVRVLDKLGGLAIFATLAMTNSPNDAWFLMAVVVTYFIVRLCVQLFLPAVNALRSLSGSFFAVIYVALPLGLMIPVARMAMPYALLMVLALIWINDTGAYLVGSSLGKHRLFERISPKKSWEGFAGGMALCVVAAVIARLCGVTPMAGMGVAGCVVLAVLVSGVATLGDLLESLLKRTAGVKDSGNVIPGHGGVLDRIDSLLLVVPAVFVLFTMMQAL